MALLTWAVLALLSLGSVSVRDSLEEITDEASQHGAIRAGLELQEAEHSMASRQHDDDGESDEDSEKAKSKEKSKGEDDTGESGEEKGVGEDNGEDNQGGASNSEAGRNHGEAKYVYHTATEGFDELDKVVESIDAAADDASTKAKTVDKDYAAYQRKMVDTAGSWTH